MKIKEEPVDVTLNTDTTDTSVKNFYNLKNDTLIRNRSNITNHDKVSLSENDVSQKIVNNKNKRISNSHSAYVENADKSFNLKRKRMKTKQERDVQSKKKQKRANDFQISKSEHMNMSMEITKKLRKKSKRQSMTSDYRTKKQHTARSSKRKISTECNICFRKFSSFRNYEAHKQYYTANNQVYCKKCKKIYMTRRRLYYHTMKCYNMTQNHSIVSNPSKICCNFCNRDFKNKMFLQSHLFHFHSELIYSNKNITKCKNAKHKNKNIFCEDNDNLADVHEKSPCSNNFVKSKKQNINLMSNNNSRNDDDTTKPENLRTEESFSDGMSPTKKLRQPTLTEYLELCKRKRDINASLNKLNIVKDDFSSTLFHDEKIATNFKPKFSEIYDEQVDSLSTKSNNLGQTAHSTLEQDKNIQNHKMLRKPFVKLHADVEMMKSFLEKLPNITIEDKTITDQRYDIVSCHEVPYSLRSLRTISSEETISNSRKRNNKDIFKKSQSNTEYTSSTRTEHNVTNSNKIDSNFWETAMARFKCKDCRIILTRCDEKIRNCHQIPPIKITFNENISVPSQSNSMSLQENYIRNKMMLKNLEVSLERLTTVPAVDITKIKTVSDIEGRNTDSFLCKVCKKNFSSKLDKHMHIKSSHTAYMSSICDARYKLKHKLLQHYLSEHLLKQDQCCVCYILLPNDVELKRHLSVHCLKYVQSENDQCPIDIEIKCSLIRNNYKCLQCGTAFLTQSSLMIHQSLCILQEKMTKDQKDPMKEINALPKIILKVQRSKNTNGLRVICDENTPFDECSSRNFVETTNEHRISLISEENSKVTEEDSEVSEEPKINEDKQKSSVNNNLVTKEIGIINESQNSGKLLENDNSISNQDIAKAQLDVIKSKINIYPCEICGKQFHTSKNLQQHIRTFSYTIDICPICGTGFSSKRLLQTHISAAHVPQISKTYSFHCMFCNQGFIKKYELRSHMYHLHGQQIDTITHDSRASQEESDTQTAICNMCNLVFETHDRYVEHRMYYNKNHTFICSLCGQNFQGMYMLHHHNKLTHYSEDKRKSYKYICEICSEGFNHESHFHSHNMHVHLNEESLSEIAKKSEERNQFDHASEVQEQIRDCSTKQQKEIEQLPNKYTCQICQLKCVDADDMAKHTAFYSNDGNFKCDRCKRQCKTLDLLYQHRRLTHICRDVYNGYMCCICGEVLESIISLECHKKHFHSNDIACNNADDSKNYKQILSSNTTNEVIKHQLESNDSHNTAKCRYNCLFCDMKFFSANAIQTHIIQTHLDDLFAKRTGLKPAFSIIESDNICKPSVQQFVEVDQTSISATLASAVTTTSAAATRTLTSSTVIASLVTTTTTATITSISASVTSIPATSILTTATVTSTPVTATVTSIPATATVTSTPATTTVTSTPARATIISTSATTITSTSVTATITSTSAVVATTSTPAIVATTSTLAIPVTAFEDNSTLFLQDKFPNNILNEIKDKTNSELSNQTKIMPSKDSKIVQKIFEIPFISGFRANKAKSVAIVLNNQFDANNVKASIPLSTESKSSNDSQKIYTNSTKSRSINEFKSNVISSTIKSTDKFNVPVIQSTGLLKTVLLVPQASVNNEITNQKFESMSSYNCNNNSNYACPLCPLEYPSLMFFHAHLRYAHADSIRTDYPLFNQSIQEISVIKCLLCLCTFTDENKYKSHLKNSHARTNISNSKNMKKTDDKKKSTTPEIITVDDDDDDDDSVENNLNQRTAEATTTLVHEKQNEKIGKLRVKSFAKIMENLSMEYASKHLQSKEISHCS